MRRPAGATLDAAFDTAMEAVLMALLVFTPLAFGTVHTWAVCLMQAGLALLLGLWLCRLIWSRTPSRAARSRSGDEATFTLLGYRFARTRLGLPIVLFIVLVLLQLIPLPPSLLRAISPAAAAAYARALPGYAQGSRVDFTLTGHWFLGVAPGGEGVVDRLFAAPGETPLKASLAHSVMRTPSLYPFATWTRLLMLLALLAAFVVVANGVRAPAQRERLFWVVTLVGFAISLLGMVQRLQWNGKIYWFYPAGGDASPFGPFFNYNHFAAYLEMAIPLALGMFLARLADISDRGYPPEAIRPAAGSPQETGLPESAPPRRASFFRALLRRGPDPLARLGLSGFATVVMLTAFILAGSRGAILSLGAAIVIYCGVMASRRQMGRLEWLAGLTVLAAALAFSAWIGGGRLSEVARRLESVARFRTEPSLSGRLVTWVYTLRIVADYPLIGSGLGTFPEAWIHYYPAGTASVWKEAHNDYLQVAAETGMAGFLIFAWGLWIFLRRYLFRRRATREEPLPGTPPGGAPGDVYVRHGLAVGILAVLLHSWVDFSLQVGAVALLFVVASAIMVGDTLRHTEA